MDGNSNGSSGDGQISPSTNGNVADFSDVASRTHQKIGDDGVSMKRPFDGSNDSQPEAKKLAADPSIGSTAQRSAQAVAAQINSKFGGNGNDRESSPGNSETINVPDHLVGLLIGKGGEQIASIQAQTDCKIQFAPESGSAERVCTLIGSPTAIQRARETINGLVEKMQGVGPPPNSSGGHFGDDHAGGNSLEMMIPGGKVGLIIGKGGETIKMLQDRAGVKIMVVQDSNQATNHDKPLRISGDKAACQRAKQMVLDLMAEKDNPMGFQGGSQFGPRSGGKLEIPVPREKVAMIIGKGGDVIRRIQEQSGCRVQFKTDDGGPTRMCTITGDDQCVEIASNIIRDIMENGTRPGSFNRGGGGPPGGFGGPGSDWGGPMGLPLPGIRGGFGPNGTQYAVPADKCGLVIGKGGENIREINRVSGAHVELNRDSAQDRHERLFRIQGSHDQIQHAIQLIHEKCGIPMPAGGGFMGGPMGPMGGPPMPGPLPGAPMGGPNPYGPPAPQGPPMGSQPGMMPPQQPVYGQSWGNPYPQPIPQQQPQQQPQVQLPYAQPVQTMPPTAAPAPIDPSKPAGDPNAAAWAAYYAQYYGQPAAASVAPMAPMQQPGQPMAYPGVPVASAAPAAAPVAAQAQPTLNQATGQLDYSQAWAEYYRQQGMHQHAAAILANQAASQTGIPHA